MAYIGNEPFVSGNFSSSVHNGTGSELTFAMGQSPGTKNAVLVFIDGVRQVPTIYGVSGSDVVFTAGNAPPLGVGNVQILVSGEELGVNVPADDSVTTVKILDDSVTTDKLANAINTTIAANTAKVTNATHTGDVTGATALTIANDAVTLAKMAGGTDGNLITYDTSGDPAYVATGTATHVLTSNGADTAPTFQAVAAGGDLTPAWQMSMSAPQLSMTSSVWYDVNFNAADVDTDSGCDTTAHTYTIPAGGGGKYMVGVRLFTGNNSGGYGYTLLNDSQLKLRKNPAGADDVLMDVWMDWRNNPVRRGPLGGSLMLDLTAGDILYVEVKNHITTAGNYGIIQDGDGNNVFYGFKLLGV